MYDLQQCEPTLFTSVPASTSDHDTLPLVKGQYTKGLDVNLYHVRSASAVHTSMGYMLRQAWSQNKVRYWEGRLHGSIMYDLQRCEPTTFTKAHASTNDHDTLSLQQVRSTMRVGDQGP